MKGEKTAIKQPSPRKKEKGNGFMAFIRRFYLGLVLLFLYLHPNWLVETDLLLQMETI